MTKRNAIKVRAGTLALALITLFSLLTLTLVSCGKTGTGENTTSPVEATTAPAAVVTEADFGEDLDYNQTEVRFLVWSDAEHDEFGVDEATLNGDIILESIFKRNTYTEDKLNVKLVFIGEKGNSSNLASYVDRLGNSLKGGTVEYEISAAYSQTGGMAASKGYLTNLLDVGHMDFDSEWWPAVFINEAKINNKLYFVSGDISTNMLHMMYVTFFNKATITDAGLEDPYTLVKEGKWTIDKLMEMAQGRYADSGEKPGVKDGADTYGFASYSVHTEVWFTGSGIKSIGRDTDGTLAVSPTFGSEKTQSILEKVCSAYYASNDFYFTGTNTAAGKEQQNIFAEGRSLFMFDRARLAMNKLRDYNDLSYGVLPIPKYDVEQENYITLMANPFTLYGIPTNVGGDAADMAGAVLECQAIGGYRYTTPAIFEVAMKAKYVDSGMDGEMYDIVRESVSIDMGRIFNTALAKIPGQLTTLVTSNSTNWTSMYKSMGTQLEKLLGELNKQFN